MAGVVYLPLNTQPYAMINRLFLLFLFSITVANAQQTLKFREDFNDNINKWGTSSDEDHKIYIENGKYKYDIYAGWAYWNAAGWGIGGALEYTVESSFKKLSGSSSESSMGLLLPDNKWNRYMFLINPSKKEFVITKNFADDNSWKDISAWGKNDAIKGEGEDNILKIEKKGIEVFFYINGIEVFKLSNSPFYADLNGYVYIQAGYDKMKMECDYLDITVNTRINMIDNPVNGYKKVLLGENVNTDYSELCPLISPDGKSLYYTIRDNPENIGGTGDDIWMCSATNDSTWAKRERLPFPANNKSTNTMISITPDGHYALVMNRFDSDGESLGSGVSSMSMGKDGWENPVAHTIINYVNEAANVEYCLSADGTALLMAIQNDKSYGTRDIYVSFRKDPFGTEWSEPLNLGPVVNSKGGNFAPFLAADGVTLYFASNGHPGFGNADVFVTRRLDDTWTNWSVPQNLGPEINGPGWEAYYVVPASGNYAYMAQGGDLVRIKLPQSAKPNPVLLIRGRVLNAKTNEPLEATIFYSELLTGEQMGHAVSNPTTGEYSIILPYGKAYSFLADKKGFFAMNDNLDCTNIKEYAEITRDLYLTPIEVGNTIRLNNIFFDSNKSTLKPESYPELDRVAAFLKDNPGIEIEIDGHTDNVGADDSNNLLSNNRAKVVYDYIVAKGIATSRLKYKGFGETKPLATNDTDDGKAKNRRVEFLITKK